MNISLSQTSFFRCPSDIRGEELSVLCTLSLDEQAREQLSFMELAFSGLSFLSPHYHCDTSLYLTIPARKSLLAQHYLNMQTLHCLRQDLRNPASVCYTELEKKAQACSLLSDQKVVSFKEELKRGQVSVHLVVSAKDGCIVNIDIQETVMKIETLSEGHLPLSKVSLDDFKYELASAGSLLTSQEKALLTRLI